MRAFFSHPGARSAAILIVLALIVAACDTAAGDTIRDWLAPVERALDEDGVGGGADELFFEEDDVVGIPDELLTPEPNLLARDDELPLDEDEVVGIEDERVEHGGTPAGDGAPVSTAPADALQTPTPAPTSTSTAAPSRPATPSPTQTRVSGDDDVGLENLGIL